MVERITLQNVETRATLLLDMTTTPDFILQSVSWGAVKSSYHSFKYVNQIGVTVSGVTLETRDVDIIGWVLADTELGMTNRKDVLNKFVNPQQAIDLFYRDYVLRFIPTSSVKYSTTEKENNELFAKFNIVGFCPDPLFKEKSDTIIAAANTIPKFHFPLTISKEPNPPGGVLFGLRQPSLLFNVRNSGSVPIGMKIVFKAVGSLKNPSIINVSTQKFFKINKDMVAGEEISVDTIVGEKKVTGKMSGISSNYFKYRDLDSTWLQLEIGDNIFRYDAEEHIENLEVYVYHNNKFLEVQGCY